MLLTRARALAGKHEKRLIDKLGAERYGLLLKTTRDL
jgi:hypothetical protein